MLVVTMLDFGKCLVLSLSLACIIVVGTTPGMVLGEGLN